MNVFSIKGERWFFLCPMLQAPPLPRCSNAVMLRPQLVKFESSVIPVPDEAQRQSIMFQRASERVVSIDCQEKTERGREGL